MAFKSGLKRKLKGILGLGVNAGLEHQQKVFVQVILFQKWGVHMTNADPGSLSLQSHLQEYPLF